MIAIRGFLRAAFMGMLVVWLLPSGMKAYGGPIDDVDAIQGTWKQIGSERGGIKLRPEIYSLEIQGNSYSASRTQVRTCKLSLDESGEICSVDRVYDGRGSGGHDRGVLDLSGRRLRICFDASGKGRPAKVESTAGSNTLLFTWERQGALPPTTGPMEKRLDGDWMLVGTVSDGVDLPMPPSMRIAMSVASGKASELESTVIAGKIAVQSGSKRIDFIPSNKKNVIRALVDFDPIGPKLKVCEASIGSDYPTGFETKSGTAWTLRIFEKVGEKTP
jgi:uncharacterized protein (TIGR03067 family)